MPCNVAGGLRPFLAGIFWQPGIFSDRFKENVRYFLEGLQYALGWPDGFRQRKTEDEARERHVDGH